MTFLTIHKAHHMTIDKQLIALRTKGLKFSLFLIVLLLPTTSAFGHWHYHGRRSSGAHNDFLNEKGYNSGGGSRGDGSGGLGNSGGNARGHIGDTGLKAVVVTQDVLHKGDGKVYTSDDSKRPLLQEPPKSLEDQIAEMQNAALKNAKQSAEAAKRAAQLEAKSKALDAELAKKNLELLKSAKEKMNKVLSSPKEEIAKDVIPIVGVTPHSIGFVEHDKVALQRLNQVRKAAFMEGQSQKNNALVHENSHPLNPIQDIKSDPELIKQLYANAPVNKKSAIVDPSKGRFSIMNDGLRKKPHQKPKPPCDDNAVKSRYGGGRGSRGRGDDRGSSSLLDPRARWSPWGRRGSPGGRYGRED